MHVLHPNLFVCSSSRTTSTGWRGREQPNNVVAAFFSSGFMMESAPYTLSLLEGPDSGDGARPHRWPGVVLTPPLWRPARRGHGRGTSARSPGSDERPTETQAVGCRLHFLLDRVRRRAEYHATAGQQPPRQARGGE